jgi:hypothetical protein
MLSLLQKRCLMPSFHPFCFHPSLGKMDENIMVVGRYIYDFLGNFKSLISSAKRTNGALGWEAKESRAFTALLSRALLTYHSSILHKF